MTTYEIIQQLIKAKPLEHKPLSNFYDGEFVESKNHIDSYDPSIGKPWIRIPNSNADDVEKAVQAAKSAFPSWSSTSAQYRAKLLNRLADVVEANLDGFAVLESRDQGKPIALAKRIDIPRCIHNFRFFASAVQHVTTSSTLIDEPVHALNYVKNDPVGVAGLISPWNLPLYLLSFKLAPALACGNTVVFKPSELTSVTAWVLMHAVQEIGFPRGVINMVIGTGPSAGEPLVVHPDVPLISFTGSTLIGKRIGELGAKLNKKVSLEMGGKNACIVYPSCDLEKIIDDIARSCFINQGEICLCSSRIFVHKEVYEEFVEKLVIAAKGYTVGDSNKNVSLGPLNSEGHFNKVKSYIELAHKEGKVLCGGVVKLPGEWENGYYVSATVVVDIDDESRCMREEIFGPVVCVSKFSSPEEVVRRVNATPYGLSASVWSANNDELLATANALRVGTVWCNCWLVRDLNMPFGGTKESGIGREGAIESIHFFTEQKTICVKLPKYNS